jgi:hypothetical protein
MDAKLATMSPARYKDYEPLAHAFLDIFMGEEEEGELDIMRIMLTHHEDRQKKRWQKQRQQRLQYQPQPQQQQQLQQQHLHPIQQHVSPTHVTPPHVQPPPRQQLPPDRFGFTGYYQPSQSPDQ